MGRRPDKLVWVDTETSGLNPKVCGIIEIALVKTTLDGSRVFEKFHSKVRLDPDNTVIEPEALKINGYSEEAWKEAISPEAMLEHIERFCTWGTQLAGHNVRFDRDMMEGAFLRAKRRCPPFFSELVDTVSLCYPLLVRGHVSDLKLGTLAKYFGIEQQEAHTALDDIRTSYKIYLKVLSLFPPLAVV